MDAKKAKISVSQERANSLFKKELNAGAQYQYRKLVNILELEFPGINSNQCSSIIHRAHANEDGVLTKKGKFYSLRTARKPATGLEKVKEKIRELAGEVNNIPVSEFKTADEFEDFKAIQKALKELT